MFRPVMLYLGLSVTAEIIEERNFTGKSFTLKIVVEDCGIRTKEENPDKVFGEFTRLTRRPTGV